MSVRIVTDSAAELSVQRAEELGIAVVEHHLLVDEEQTGTAGPTALELCAAYARQLERGHDDGVLALHVSRELSSTWNSGVSASAVFDDLVEVIDTQTAGAVMGEAAAAAAKVAKVGGVLSACKKAAEDVLGHSSTWLYVHSLEQLRRSGRISVGAAVMSSALAPRPLMRLTAGKLEIAARTRTRSKALTRLAQSMRKVIEENPERTPTVIIQYRGAQQECEAFRSQLIDDLPESTQVSLQEVGPALATHIGDGAAIFSLVMR